MANGFQEGTRHWRYQQIAYWQVFGPDQDAACLSTLYPSCQAAACDEGYSGHRIREVNPEAITVV
jgi:hypothetical protein